MDENEMAEWMKYAAPGEEHEYLKRMEGKFKARCKFWMGPGDPQVSEGIATNEMVLGGRFLQSRFEGPSPFGPPFAGLGMDGYDRFQKKYIGTWADTMGTMMMVFEGQLEGDVRTMVCECKDVMTGQPTQMKGVTTVVSDDEHTYEMWNRQADGQFVKAMEIVFKRV